MLKIKGDLPELHCNRTIITFQVPTPTLRGCDDRAIGKAAPVHRKDLTHALEC